MADFEFTITETSSMVDLEEYLNYLIIVSMAIKNSPIMANEFSPTQIN